MTNRHGFRNMAGLLLATLLALVWNAPVLAQVEEIPTRDQIEDKYKWDLSDFYPSDEAWEAELAKLQQVIPTLARYEGRLGKSSDILAEFLERSDSAGMYWHRMYVYANLKLDEDNRVSKYQDMSQRAYGVYANFNEVTSFAEPEILAIDSKKLQKFINTNKRLAVYRFYLEDLIRRKEHIMAPEVERILAMSGQVGRGPSQIFKMLDEADMDYGTITDDKGNVIELTPERYGRILEGTDRELRRKAAMTYDSAYARLENTFAATMAASFTADNFYAQARNYPSCLASSLFGNNIPEEVVHNLVKATNDNLATVYKFNTLRKKVLGYDTLFKYDMSVPLVEKPDIEYDYATAQKMVLTALAPLGQDYLNSVKMAFDSRWIDVYETKAKGTGAYSWGTYTVHPVMLLNYNNTLNSVSTLAHEMGHAMHSFYTYKNEPYTYAGHSLFCAEVASTCNESIMLKYLLENSTDKKERLYLLDYYIQQIIGTFFSQVMFTEYELRAHEIIENGGALTAESMRAMYREIFEKYNGPDLYLLPINDIGCLRIGHFYRQYYVFQYATSYAASQMLSQMILEGKPGAQEAYLEFVKTGSSAYPIDILKKAGIDMTSPEPVNNVFKVLGELVDMYEKELLGN
jgi:oligoendopeptidase F